MQRNRYLVFLATPQGLDSTAFVIAADRAGGLGILNCTGHGSRDRAIRRMREFKVQSYAILVQPHEVRQAWLVQAGENLVAVVCSSLGTPEQLKSACTRIHSANRQALCEVMSGAQAEAALDAGCDGLIAVGHEAGGWVGMDSAFILLQAILARTDRPVWVRGGIGPRVAAGCIAAGATGVVLEGAILLARESPLAEAAHMRLGAWDGSELMLIEPADGPAIRVYAPTMSPVLVRLREEQLAAVRAALPPFALIGVGRPDQAAELERDGIATYLHAPSPGLLEQYLRSGARRFVLEGRECGGHVGPRSSFILWEQACRVLEEAIAGGVAAESLSVVFAGGIHDARSFALVAATAGDLAARGMKIGILMGTAYLFTREAVTTGAIIARFQDEAFRCRGTVLIETGPGHQVRVSRTPFVVRFAAERDRLLALGKPHEEIRESLERLNVGRLRLAAKGVNRSRAAGAPLVAVADAQQAADCLYLLGQVAALRDRVLTISDLHQDVTAGATAWIEQCASDLQRTPRAEPSPAAVAIVGMAAVLPGAKDVATFWANSLSGFDAITEVPADRWDWRLYYDPDPKAPDKVYSKWGGFLPDVPFDPLRHGMPPTSLLSIEPAQLLALEVARAALPTLAMPSVLPRVNARAWCWAWGVARPRLPLVTPSGRICRCSTQSSPGAERLRWSVPGGGTAAMERCQGLLPEWTEDSFAGFLLNVTAGRIANRLDLGGANYTVDAACGSSLAGRVPS